MNKFFVFLVFTFIGGGLFAQTQVTGLPNQLSNLYEYDAVQFSDGNHLYIGGNSSQGPLTWNAYPGSAQDEFRFRYSNTNATQLTYSDWNGLWQFKVSDNSPSYGGTVTWRPILTISRYNQVYVNGEFILNDLAGTIQFKVETNGKVNCREVEVDMDIIPDYVFEEDYELMSLEELEQYIKTNKHLPNIPSAAEYGERGAVALGEMNRLLLEKVEELTLYTLEQEEAQKTQAAQIEALEAQLAALAKKFEQLEHNSPNTKEEKAND